MSNREYTLQYMLDYDWMRVTAVYRNIEDLQIHACDLLMQGRIVRLLARDPRTRAWYTVKLRSDGGIMLDLPVNCPE